MNKYLSFPALILLSIVSTTRHEISGTITDSRKEPVINAGVKLYRKGIAVDSTTTGYNGHYTLKAASQGNYDVTAYYMRLKTVKYVGVIVGAGHKIPLSISLPASSSRTESDTIVMLYNSKGK
jgi:hypothetical protein